MCELGFLTLTEIEHKGRRDRIANEEIRLAFVNDSTTHQPPTSSKAGTKYHTVLVNNNRKRCAFSFLLYSSLGLTKFCVEFNFNDIDDDDDDNDDYNNNLIDYIVTYAYGITQSIVL